MNTILKTTLKLLFRNKGFWFFLVLTPVLSIIMLNVKVADSSYYAAGFLENEIGELEGPDEKVAYYNNGNGVLIIKVYDASGSDISEYFLKSLADNGLFKILRAKVNEMTFDEYRTKVKNDGIEDRMTAAMYLSPDFDRMLFDGNSTEALSIDLLSDDGRYEMFVTEVKNAVMHIQNAAVLAGYDPGKTLELLKSADALKIEKEIVELQNPDTRVLSREQNNKKTRMGYVFAFLTLGFMFCGVFVAHTVIQEQKEQVLTRIKLTNAGNVTYFLAKLLSGVVVSALLTIILGIGIMFISEENLGMARGQILVLTFLLGLIFCSVSLLLGILFEDVMTANVVAFTIWSLSSLLSGLYFPLNATTKLIKVISGIMPQKWFMEGTEMIFVGDNSAYIMLLCIVAAYLTFVISIAGLGLKMKKAEA